MKKTKDICVEADPGGQSTIKSSCDGTYTAGAACTHANSTGGCVTHPSGLCVTYWWYPPTTMMQAQSQCSGLQGTFINP